MWFSQRQLYFKMARQLIGPLAVGALAGAICIGLIQFGYNLGALRCADEYEPISPHWTYTVPQEARVLNYDFEDEFPAPAEYFQRTWLCGPDERCWKHYPMSEELFSYLQLQGMKLGFTVTRSWED